MIKAFLISFRDYCYNETKNSRDEEYADRTYGFVFVSGTILYYLAIPIWVYVIFTLAVSDALQNIIKANFLLRIPIGIVMVYSAFKLSAKVFLNVIRTGVRRS